MNRLAALILAALSGFALAQPQPAVQVVTHAFSTADERLVLDVYLPADYPQDADLPVIFMIHGGGYVAGRKEILAPYAAYFAERGYAVVTPQYRLAPIHPYPTPISDVVCALAWTTTNPDGYPFDLSRVAIIGESAGGNAAALLAAHDDLPALLDGCAYALPNEFTFRAAVTYYMYGDLTTCTARCGLLKRVTGGYLGVNLLEPGSRQLEAAWADASPLAWIDGSEPPTLVIHGTADNIVPISESEHYAERLADVGVTVEVLYPDGAPHGFIEKFAVTGSIEARDAVEAFLARVLAEDGSSN